MIILDIETTGLDPIENCMVSLGATDYDSGDEYYGECHIYPESKYTPEALAINGFTVEQITDTNKHSPHSLYMSFLLWCQGKEMLLAGQQVGAFDILFLKRIANSTVYKIPTPWPFGHRSVDLHSVAYAKLGKSLGLDGILQECGIQPESKPHNALNGARLEKKAFQALL